MFPGLAAASERAAINEQWEIDRVGHFGVKLATGIYPRALPMRRDNDSIPVLTATIYSCRGAGF